MTRSFHEKLAALLELHRVCPMIVQFAPRLERLPLSIQRFDEPLLPFSKAVINATRGLVMGYSFDLAAYLRFGAVGAIALERAIDYSSADGESLTVLHGGFARREDAILSDENSFGVDAVTISNTDLIAAFTTRMDRGVFVLTDSAGAGLPEGLLSQQAGIYNPDQHIIEVMHRETRVQISVLDDMLYENRDDDFQVTLRGKIEQMRHAR